MRFSELQKQTNANIQDKANLIWEIATHLVGLFKPHEYGKVILPLTVLKRFDDALRPTKDAVLATNATLKERKVEGEARDGILRTAAGYAFYNTSRFDFARLVADPDNIADNFSDYLLGFSDNVKDIIAHFKFADQVNTLAEGKALYVVLQEFTTAKGDMSPEKITAADMGYIFEELIRKFSESYDEQAGSHFTARDIIYLMTELLVSPERDKIAANGCTKTAYDMAMGTSQMLGCLDERLKSISPDADLTCFGQEFNPETYAIAKADMLIKGGNASGMKYGDTLSDDQFSGYEFDYIISNPPFGIDWKRERAAVEGEHRKKGYDGRFGPGLPAISDGQMLFMLNGIKKLKPGSGRMAIIQNGSSLFTGDAGSGASEIRRYAIEEDLVEAIVQLPNDLFYNTGISTYIWLLCKGKTDRAGKIQLIDASQCFVKRRKNIGSKRVDLTDGCLDLILRAYDDFDNGVYEDGELRVESKVFDNDFFGYRKVTVLVPELGEDGKPLMKNGKPRQNKEIKPDTEIIPLQEDVAAYMEKNVLPYNPHAYLDRAKDKIGYEIPFTRLFYKFTPPMPSEQVRREIEELDAQEAELMRELFGNA